MVAQADEAFELKLRQVVRKRLEAGQDPGAVLTELKARLEPAQAEVIFADASRTAATAKPGRANPSLDRALLVAVMIWASMLLIQNVTIVATAIEALGLGGALTGDLAPLIFSAGVKIGLLLIFGGAAVVAKTKLRFLVFAVVVLYAFPLGLLIDRALMGRAQSQGATALLSVSALLSYVSAAALVVLWWRSRGHGRVLPESSF